MRVCNADVAKAHRQYYHPGCIEGGLGPIEEVADSDKLQPDAKEAFRQHCDIEGRRTRSEYMADIRQAKRARTDQAASTTARGTPQDDEWSYCGSVHVARWLESVESARQQRRRTTGAGSR